MAVSDVAPLRVSAWEKNGVSIVSEVRDTRR